MLTGSRGDIVKIGDFGLSKSIQEYVLIRELILILTTCTLIEPYWTVLLKISIKHDWNALRLQCCSD